MPFEIGPDGRMEVFSLGEYKDYIWDLDGTLLDSYGAISGALKEEMLRRGVLLEESGILRKVKQDSVSGFLRETAIQYNWDYGDLYREYRQISHKKLDVIGLIPGAVETLRGLEEKECRHFVYTHRGSSTKEVLSRLKLEDFFSEVVTFENGFAPKPSGEGLQYLRYKYDMDPDLTAYVGDRSIDVMCARNAGVQAILFLPEGSPVEATGQENRIIRDPTELLYSRQGKKK